MNTKNQSNLPTKVIVLPETCTFLEALQALSEGTCVGIKPVGNTSYMVKRHSLQGSMSVQSGNFQLCWLSGSLGVRSDQYLGPWQLVVVDQRSMYVLDALF